MSSRSNAGICAWTHVAHARAVDRVAGERQPGRARHPQRPRLQRDAPLQLAAAVGDRVAEGEHAEPAGPRSERRRGVQRRARVNNLPRPWSLRHAAAERRRRDLERAAARAGLADSRRRSRRSPSSPTTTAGRGCPAARSCSGRSTRARFELCGGTRCGCCRRRPRRELERAAERSGAARAGRARCSQRVRGGPRAAAGVTGPSTRRIRSRSSAPSTGSTSRCRSTRAASARSPATSSRRRPTSALPLVAVGLMYRKGYFRQRIDATGWQHEYWIDTDPERLPAALVTGDDGEPLTISVPIYDANVTARIWRVDVGRVPLYPARHRLSGERAARALDHRAPVRRRPRDAPRAVRAARRRRRPGAARARDRAGRRPPERGPRRARAARARRARRCATATSLDARARRRSRPRTVFTTHTPVPAGNDTYPAELVERAVGRARGRARRADLES